MAFNFNYISLDLAFPSTKSGYMENSEWVTFDDMDKGTETFWTIQVAQVGIAGQDGREKLPYVLTFFHTTSTRTEFCSPLQDVGIIEPCHWYLETNRCQELDWISSPDHSPSPRPTSKGSAVPVKAMLTARFPLSFSWAGLMLIPDSNINPISPILPINTIASGKGTKSANGGPSKNPVVISPTRLGSPTLLQRVPRIHATAIKIMVLSVMNER